MLTKHLNKVQGYKTQMQMKKRQTSEDLYFTACVTERDVCSLHFEQNRHYMPSTLLLYF